MEYERPLCSLPSTRVRVYGVRSHVARRGDGSSCAGVARRGNAGAQSRTRGHTVKRRGSLGLLLRRLLRRLLHLRLWELVWRMRLRMDRREQRHGSNQWRTRELL